MVCFVYMMTNEVNSTLYTGVTNDLIRRVYEHRQMVDPYSFTAKYRVHKLVYYEATSDINSAIAREKQIKGWNRRRKNQLIEGQNPNWSDLYPDLLA